jgi:hypothetical protein
MSAKGESPIDVAAYRQGDRRGIMGHGRCGGRAMKSVSVA